MKYLPILVILCLQTAAGFKASGQTPLLPRDPSIKGPQTFAIVVGVSKYKYVKQLAYADKDAILFRDYLRSPGGGRVKDENIFCLLDEQANNSNFWGKGFQWLKAKQLQKGDRLFIYLAGHGDAIDEDQFFFLGFDCNPQGDKNNYLVSGAIQLFNLKKKIFNETTKGVEVFFIMDACRSNELPGGTAGQSFFNTAVSEKKVGEIIMLATGAGEVSLEDASIGTGHGLFTYYLVDGLSGVADSIGGHDNKVTFREIQAYVNKNVPSVALQRFKRKQDPYFCCKENSDRVISRVDTAYLQQWLRTKKQQTRGPGNSFHAEFEKKGRFVADTLLLETYNLFYKAVSNKNITGNSSAENYYQQLEKKFPGNPYTLDAKSTLAVELINIAQAKVDRYVGCSGNGSSKEKQSNYEAALNLEKAIEMVREDDEDFANSLRNRMYLLKACGDFGNGGVNGELALAFQYAYGAMAIDRNGAYILNKLALLHLENNRADSAVYYADKAAKIAPNWACALTTLALAQKALTNNNPVDTVRKNKKPNSKIHWGLSFGAGISKPSVTTRPANANDTLRVLGIRGKFKFDLGILGQVALNNRISIKPSLIISFEHSEIDFERKRSTGGPITEVIAVETISFTVPVPFIFRLSDKNVAPFISIGPTFSFATQGDDINSQRLPVKSFDVLADAGFGVDIGIPKGGFIISPELKYTRGLLDAHENNGSAYSNVITKLNKQAFTLSVSLRKR